MAVSKLIASRREGGGSAEAPDGTSACRHCDDKNSRDCVCQHDGDASDSERRHLGNGDAGLSLAKTAAAAGQLVGSEVYANIRISKRQRQQQQQQQSEGQSPGTGDQRFGAANALPANNNFAGGRSSGNFILASSQQWRRHSDNAAAGAARVNRSPSGKASRAAARSRNY